MLKGFVVSVFVTLLVGFNSLAAAKSVLIDVRTPQEYTAGHIDGALNIDHELITQRISAAGVQKDDEVVLYCHSGRRAGIAQQTLKDMGYSKVVNFGGMEDATRRLCSLGRIKGCK